MQRGALKSTHGKILLNHLQNIERDVSLQSEAAAFLQEVLKKDVYAGRLPDENGNNAYHILTIGKYPESLCLSLLQILVQVCPEGLRSKNKSGYLPLHLYLVRRGTLSVSIINLLLTNYPASASTVDPQQGMVPLFFCVMRDYDEQTENPSVGAEIVKMMCRAYPEGPRCLNRTGSHPLHFACRRPRPCPSSIAILLRRHRAAVHQTNDYGFLPIHCLASCCDVVASDGRHQRKEERQRVRQCFQLLFEAAAKGEGEGEGEEGGMDAMGQGAIQHLPMHTLLLRPDRQGRLPLHLLVLATARRHAEQRSQQERTGTLLGDSYGRTRAAMMMSGDQEESEQQLAALQREVEALAIGRQQGRGGGGRGGGEGDKDDDDNGSCYSSDSSEDADDSSDEEEEDRGKKRKGRRRKKNRGRDRGRGGGGGGVLAYGKNSSSSSLSLNPSSSSSCSLSAVPLVIELLRDLVYRAPASLLTTNNFQATAVDTVLEKTRPGERTTGGRVVRVFGLYDDPLLARYLLLYHRALLWPSCPMKGLHLLALRQLNAQARWPLLLASYAGDNQTWLLGVRVGVATGTGEQRGKKGSGTAGTAAAGNKRMQRVAQLLLLLSQQRQEEIVEGQENNGSSSIPPVPPPVSSSSSIAGFKKEGIKPKQKPPPHSSRTKTSSSSSSSSPPPVSSHSPSSSTPLLLSSEDKGLLAAYCLFCREDSWRNDLHPANLTARLRRQGQLDLLKLVASYL